MPLRCSRDVSRYVHHLSSTPLIVALVVVSATAQAEGVSDADRAAARELYVQGVELQQAGRFAEALDRFNRAQAVFSAPTHLLHIAECEASLGKLVESAETYRTLVRTPLPAGAPQAFVLAQQQAGTELTQVEPRLPSIRVVVRPENLQGLQVQVDGQPMSIALVGVQRPTDPGNHTVTVYAPGYARANQRVALQERENRDVTIALQASSGVVYGATPPYQPYPPAVQPAQPAPQYAPAPAPYGAPPPYGPPPAYEVPEERRPAAGGFMLGADLGVLFPGGNTGTVGGGSDTSVSSFASTGGAIGINAGFRFVRRLYLGIDIQHGFLGTGNGTAGTTSSSNTNFYALNFAYLSNPDGVVGFYGELGVGYRTLTNDTTPSGGAETSTTLKGGDVSLGIGMHIHVGEWVRLIPKISVSGGQFDSASCNGSNCASGNNTTISDTDAHSFVFLGVTGMVDFARKR
jgi:hypothetical protein